MLSFAVDSARGSLGADRNAELHPATAMPRLETLDGSEPPANRPVSARNER
jgi:hypothetical protein